MPLTGSEEQQVAWAFLECFGEDAYWCGRALKFMSEYTVGQVNLLATVQAEALTWQPFIDAGLTISWWNDELERNYDLTYLP